MAYGDFKDLPGRTAADKVLHHKVFNIVKNPIYDDMKEVYQWISMVINAK